MKRRTIATILNFVLPGAGLWYLDRKKSAGVNLVLAILIPALGSMPWSGEHAHYFFLAVAAGSAGYAHAVGTAVGANVHPARQPEGSSG